MPLQTHEDADKKQIRLAIKSNLPVMSCIICDRPDSRCVALPGTVSLPGTASPWAELCPRTRYWGGSEDCAGGSDRFLCMRMSMRMSAHMSMRSQV